MRVEAKQREELPKCSPYKEGSKPVAVSLKRQSVLEYMLTNGQKFIVRK